MKRLVGTLMLSLGLALGSGCATVAPGEDPVQVRAEQALGVSFIVLDEYLKYADLNRSTLSRKEVDLANKIRTWGKSYVVNSRKALLEYQDTGAPGAKRLVLEYVEKLDDLVLEVERMKQQ